jgi:hypothetical protein
MRDLGCCEFESGLEIVLDERLANLCSCDPLKANTCSISRLGPSDDEMPKRVWPPIRVMK